MDLEAPAIAAKPRTRFEAFARVFIVMCGPVMAGLLSIPLVPALPQMATYFSGGKDGAFFSQIVVTLPALMMLLTAPFIGNLTRRCGKRRVLLSALVLFSISGLAGLVVTTMAGMTITRVLIGLAGSVIYTLYLSFAADFFGGEARRRVIGFAISMSLVGSLVELSIGGWLVDQYGWRAPFWFYAFGIVAFIVAWFGVHPPETSEVVRAEAVAAPRSETRDLAALLPFYLLLMLLGVGMFALSIQGPFVLMEKGITSATTQGLILSAWSLTAAMSAAAYAWLRRRMGDATLLAVIGVLLGGGLIATGFAQGLVPIILSLFIVGFGKGLVAPSIEALILNRAPVSVRVRAAGLIVSALFLSQFATPIVGNALGLLFGLGGGVAMIGLLVLIAGLAMPISASIRRLVPRSTATE